MINSWHVMLSRVLDVVAFCIVQTEAGNVSDLSSDAADDAGVSSDPVIGKLAAKPKDIVVFVNLVDFCR